MKFLIVLCFLIAERSASSLSQVQDFKLENTGEERITNGQIAHPKEFPYQAGLELHKKDRSGFCGGSVISADWILTAAHCTLAVKAMTVYLGYFDLKTGNEGEQQKIYTSKENFILHPEWNRFTISNDIAAIRLPEKIMFNGIEC